MDNDTPEMSVEHWANRPEPESLNRVDVWGSKPKEDNGWISVDLMLPKEGDQVLILIDGDRIPLVSVGEYDSKHHGCWRVGNCFIVWDYDFAYEMEVTHWAELPPMLKDQAS